MSILSLIATIPLAVVLSLGTFTLGQEFLTAKNEDFDDRLVIVPAFMFYAFFAGLFWFLSFHILTH